MSQHPKVVKSGNPRSPFAICFKNEDGKRVRKCFTSRLAAEEAASKITLKAKLPESLIFSNEERIQFHQIKAQCEALGVSLSEANACLRTHFKDFVKSNEFPKKSWNEAFREYIGDCQRRNIRPNTLRGYQTHINLFYKKFTPETINELTEKQVASFFDVQKSPKHYQASLRAFFNFCQTKKWIDKNPFERVPIPNLLKDKDEIEILSVEETDAFLNSLPLIWQPLFAIMAFCGVRPMEMVSDEMSKSVLRISDIDFKRKMITVPASCAKGRQPRRFSPAPNLWKWLAPLKKRPASETVAPGNYWTYSKILKKCGTRNRRDILRHSFGSYGYHYLGAERTVEIMGHIGGFYTFIKRYKGLAEPEEATGYFAIIPQKNRDS